MKLLVILTFTFFVSYFIYLFFRKKKKLGLTLAIIFALSMVIMTASAIHRGQKQPDGWCGRPHQTISYPPEKQVTAMDFFELGNYEYDLGNCEKAIEAYSKSIKLNPKYAQSYNNRGYTYMRLREFDEALLDLTIALGIKPDYVNALRNRADVYSYKKDYEMARKDYETAIKFGGSNNLCGDLFTAKFEGTGFFNQLFNFPKFMIECGRR